MKVLIVSDIIINAFLVKDFDADCQKILDWSSRGRIEGYIAEETLAVIRERRGGTEEEQEEFIENIKKKVRHVVSNTNGRINDRALGREVRVACLCAYEHNCNVIVTANDNLYRNGLSENSNRRVRVLLPSKLIRKLEPISPRLRVLLLAAIVVIGIGVLAAVIKKTHLFGLIKTPKLTSSTVDKVCGLRIQLNTPNQPRGERSEPDKKTKEGIDRYGKGDYNAAIESLCEALKLNRNNPEAVIYLNNSYLKSFNIESYTIAALRPEGSSFSAEVLRGVAQAQDEINGSPERIKGKGLEVNLDHTDKGQPGAAVSTVQEIADDKANIIAVVGPFHSTSTIYALDEYKRKQLVFVSPASTSNEFSTNCKTLHESGNGFCFRTIPSNAITTRKITDFLFELPPEYRRAPNSSLLPVAIFYSGGKKEPESDTCSTFSGTSDLYSSDLAKSLCNDLSNKNKGNPDKFAVKIFNLDASNFDAKKVVNEALSSGAKTLVLFPGDDKQSLDNIKAIIRENQEKKFILIGGDSLYKPELLEEEGKDLVGSPHPFLFVSPWMRPSSPNTAFLRSAKHLWTTSEVSWATATSYDATRILASAFEKLPIQDRTKEQQSGQSIQRTRNAVQQALVNQQLPEAESATDKAVSFDQSNGNRKEETSQLVIVKPDCSGNQVKGYTFSRFNPTDSQDDRCQ